MNLTPFILPDIDDELRSKSTHLGDLGDMVEAAVNEFDLVSGPLIAIRPGRGHGPPVKRATTLNVSNACHSNLKTSSKRRGVSMNVLTNSAFAHWLESQRPEIDENWPT
jgi:hypothetical protein